MTAYLESLNVCLPDGCVDHARAVAFCDYFEATNAKAITIETATFSHSCHPPASVGYPERDFFAITSAHRALQPLSRSSGGPTLV